MLKHSNSNISLKWLTEAVFEDKHLHYSVNKLGCSKNEGLSVHNSLAAEHDSGSSYCVSKGGFGLVNLGLGDFSSLGPSSKEVGGEDTGDE